MILGRGADHQQLEDSGVVLLLQHDPSPILARIFNSRFKGNKDRELRAKIKNLRQRENLSLVDIMPQTETLMNFPTKESQG